MIPTYQKKETSLVQLEQFHFAQFLTKEEVKALAKLPGLEVLRAQLLGLLTQPATGFVRVINAVPQGLVNVLQAKARN